MKGQAELFEMARVGEVEVPRARCTDPETSHAAARSMRDVATVQRDAIVQVLRRAQAPLTYREIADRLGWEDDPVRVARRLKELRTAGRIRAVGKAVLENGRSATTYVATRAA